MTSDSMCRFDTDDHELKHQTKLVLAFTFAFHTTVSKNAFNTSFVVILVIPSLALGILLLVNPNLEFKQVVESIKASDGCRLFEIF